MLDSSRSRAQWGSRIGFILAAAGSAVGLGNIWKFPYITGNNGGGAFVLVYLVCIALVGLPIMIAELMIGRHTRRDAVGAFISLEGRRSPWQIAGWVSILAAFVILSYYSVVAGWTLDFILRALQGAFTTPLGTNTSQAADHVSTLFQGLIDSGPRQLMWHFIFISLCLGIVIGGVQKGIERWSKILMPILLGLLVLLFVNGMLSDGARQALNFMFRPDFQKLNPGAVLEALGHAFFTLSLGMAAMITYGSYLSRQDSLFGSGLRIALLDTGIALMAGLAIFPIVFSAGMQPGAGPGLVFQTIPVVFSNLPGGNILALLFFLLLAFAALTSAISLLESQVAYLIDERGWGRKQATAFLAILAFVVGIPSALSSNLLGHLTPIADLGVFDSIDLIASNYLLPVSGLLTALYVGWFWSGQEEKEELLAGGSGWIYPTWHFLIRFVAPVAVGVILYSKIEETGLFSFLGSIF
ncbi:sodium-dependent transporter, SNF family [Syntrophotalea carbinolica DSM 2380]|uniref:Transporter n=1 Tax=Syntrophotalea carbinolica (strain DSM 2380 / NBRC 103641 / GraBd1) TaxID=338963 RepID=Q3A7I2_SYNC1|nr:sodium-dependent transporter [Syntrophotalea carbinolica]ABA87662.1 sodium-dependent transporter, SNF family [Syntrophotalea carbinolica DSM 2380]